MKWKVGNVTTNFTFTPSPSDSRSLAASSINATDLCANLDLSFVDKIGHDLDKIVHVGVGLLVVAGSVPLAPHARRDPALTRPARCTGSSRSPSSSSSSTDGTSRRSSASGSSTRRTRTAPRRRAPTPRTTWSSSFSSHRAASSAFGPGRQSTRRGASPRPASGGASGLVRHAPHSSPFLWPSG